MLTISKAKELMKDEGYNSDSIENIFGAYSNDISIEEYLKNEHGIVLRTMEDIAEGIENFKEEKQRHDFYNPESVEWRKISKTLKSAAIVGMTGTGKTAIAYKILESFEKKIYAYRHPLKSVLNERGFKLFNNLSEIEHLADCVVWIDEPQLYIATYDKKANVILMRLLSLCRQRDITLIISTSDTRFITRGLESYFDIWILKDMEFDLIKKGSIIKKIIKENVYIIDDGFSLNIDEFIFYSRSFKDYNGKHSFNIPRYFDMRHSKPYAFVNAKVTANDSPK